MTPEREQDLVAAHRVGRAYAQSLIAASKAYRDEELESVFLAAIVGDLRRAGVKMPTVLVLSERV